MGRSHAITGAGLWLAGWGWAATAGLADPGVDVLTVGTMLCTGAALLPDFDHESSHLAYSGARITRRIGKTVVTGEPGFEQTLSKKDASLGERATRGFARTVGRIGAGIHAATKLDADRPDKDGHRTITHTFVFALLAGTLVTGLVGLDQKAGPIPVGSIAAALLVLAFTGLGYAVARSAWGGRRRKVKLSRKGRRWHKSTLVAWTLAIYTFVVVPPGAWWIGLAVGAGCAIHCLGDLITESGCPVLWPIPIPATELRSPGRGLPRRPTRVWRTWYLVGTPRWMRFKVTATSGAERAIRWAMVVLSALAVTGMIWSAGWGPNA